MTALTEQENNWIVELAGRLKLVQADSAALPPAQRREFLNEEIARALKPVPPSNRKRYLEVLLTRFPVAGQTLKTAAAPAAAPVPAAPPPETFPELLDRFVQAASSLPDAQRTEAAKRLSQAGLSWVDNDSVVLEVTDDLRKSLGLKDGQQPQLRNLVQLCVLLIGKFHALDQTGLAAMRSLAPKSRLLNRPQDLPKAAGQFLVGELESVEPQVGMAMDLLTTLFEAVVFGSRDFCRDYADRLSPTAIQDVVLSEPKSMFKKTEQLCWEKYVALARENVTAELVERRIRDCTAAFVENKLRRR